MSLLTERVWTEVVVAVHAVEIGLVERGVARHVLRPLLLPLLLLLLLPAEHLVEEPELRLRCGCEEREEEDRGRVKDIHLRCWGWVRDGCGARRMKVSWRSEGWEVVWFMGLDLRS